MHAFGEQSKLTLIHDYHYKKVKDTNKKAYTSQMGKAMLVMGTGIILTGIIDFLTATQYGWCFLGIGFTIGLVMMIRAQIKYNHGIF